MGEGAPQVVLWEDDRLLVVDKPAGLLVHPSIREREGTLKCLLEVGRPGVFFPHRLDRDTSGLMVIAKDAETAGHLGIQFARRTVEKIYVAVVGGLVAEDEMVIDAPLGRDAAERPQWKVRAGGVEARSWLKVRERGEETTRVEMSPLTGRTNQLRAHCVHVGHPIVGDVWFGGMAAPRLMLHAERLGFEHPGTGEWMGFEARAPF